MFSLYVMFSEKNSSQQDKNLYPYCRSPQLYKINGLKKVDATVSMYGYQQFWGGGIIDDYFVVIVFSNLWHFFQEHL